MRAVTRRGARGKWGAEGCESDVARRREGEENVGLFSTLSLQRSTWLLLWSQRHQHGDLGERAEAFIEFHFARLEEAVGA